MSHSKTYKPRGVITVEPRMVEALRLFEHERMNRRAIADRFGVTMSTVQRWFEKVRDWRMDEASDPSPRDVKGR